MDRVFLNDVFEKYIGYVNKTKYDRLYEMLTNESKEKISEENFIARNKNIYTGIDMENMQIEITNIQEMNSKHTIITYNLEMDSSAGKISFENEVNLYKDNKKGYLIDWDSSLIFPNLLDTDKVKIKTEIAKRGAAHPYSEYVYTLQFSSIVIGPVYFVYSPFT